MLVEGKAREFPIMPELDGLLRRLKEETGVLRAQGRECRVGLCTTSDGQPCASLYVLAFPIELPWN